MNTSIKFNYLNVDPITSNQISLAEWGGKTLHVINGRPLVRWWHSVKFILIFFMKMADF